MALIDFIPEGWIPDLYGARAASRLRTGDAGEMLLKALTKATNVTPIDDEGDELDDWSRMENEGTAAVALSLQGWDIAGADVSLAWRFAVIRYRELSGLSPTTGLA
jgi:hypothetical protein